MDTPAGTLLEQHMIAQTRRPAASGDVLMQANERGNTCPGCYYGKDTIANDIP